MLAGTGIFLVGVFFAVLSAVMVKEGPRDDADVIGMVGMIVLALVFMGAGVVLTYQAGQHWAGV